MSGKFMAIGYGHNKLIKRYIVGSKKKCNEQTLIWDRHPSYSRSCVTTKEDGEKLLEDDFYANFPSLANKNKRGISAQ